MTIGRWIQYSLLLAFLRSESDAQMPAIKGDCGNFVVTLTGEMTRALRQFNRDFRTWECADYPISIREAIREDSAQLRAPFALSVDANKDGKPDIILDGHDNTHCILLCLLSHDREYRVDILRTSDLAVPGDTVHLDERMKDDSFWHFFSSTCVWTSEEHFDPNRTFVFQIVYPQRSDPSGRLITEGGSVSFYFENGRFIEGTFDPL